MAEFYDPYEALANDPDMNAPVEPHPAWRRVYERQQEWRRTAKAERSRVRELEQALVDLHESLFIGSQRGLSKGALRSMASFAKAAAIGPEAKGRPEGRPSEAKAGYDAAFGRADRAVKDPGPQRVAGRCPNDGGAAA